MTGGGVVWITGRPASGKTTLARRLADALRERGVRPVILDSDEARAAITPAPTYEAWEREIVYRALAWAASRVSAGGAAAIVAATAHSAALRRSIRSIVPELFLVHARCSAATCERRDPKGLYARARASPESTLPGVGVDYEAPADADRTVDTEHPVPGAILGELAEAIVAHRG
ncbi:adenylyl-sulfate kinase [Vulgatibacter incomptus]|uniref:Sulfate adenylyltransferase, dissimilatory-type n=1 Tax=Vulgatibacter incomptus TaxID=1391653 RepID=A0A0K1PCX6_9BACT|nr:adenylyl-sulfate kinase [Vulgatibacter incomptus]AKU91251.1 Sulfate adenylyltransferase, dissimilatory-type [Vulgatibacter incomptus]